MRFLKSLLLFILCQTLLLAGNNEAIPKIIPIYGLPAEAAEMIARQYISEEAGFIHLKDRNAILIMDDPENIKKVEVALKALKAERPNIRIYITRTGHAVKSDREFSVTPENEWGLVVKDGKIKLPEVDRININRRQQTQSSNAVMMLMTMSGYPATLWVGSKEPEWKYIDTYFSRPQVRKHYPYKPHFWHNFEVEYVKTGVELAILPRALADGLIEVEVVPRISYRKKPDGPKNYLQVETLSTKVTLIPGQSRQLSSLVGDQADRITNLFGPDFFTDSSNESILEMSIKAEIVENDKQR